MQHKTVKMGITGLGYIATQVHLPLLLKIPEVQVVALCDQDRQRLEKSCDSFRIKNAYTDLGQMLETQKLDILDICTPPNTHKALCLEALNAGVNVMVEKPLTTNVADADSMISAAKEKRLALHVLHNQSYLPVYRKAKKILQSGEIGEPLNVDVKMAQPLGNEWLVPGHWMQRLAGGPLGELAPHPAMLLLEFLDLDSVDEIHAVATNASGYQALKADELMVMVKAGNRIGSFSLTCNTSVARMTIHIIGTRLGVLVDSDAQIIVKSPPIRGGDTFARAGRVVSDILQRLCCIISASANVAIGRYRPTMPLGHNYLFKESVKAIRGEGVYPVSLEKVREEVRILEIAFTQTGLLPE